MIYQFSRHTFVRFRRSRDFEIRNDYDNVCKHFNSVNFHHNSLGLRADFKTLQTCSCWRLSMGRQNDLFCYLLLHQYYLTAFSFHSKFSDRDIFEFAMSINQLSG